MNEEAFREIMTEILESKVELLQALEDWGKKFDNLIKSIARDFIKSEPKGMTVPQDYDPLQTPKGESKIKNVKVTSNALITGKIGILTEKAVQIIVGDQFAWIPKKAVKNLNRIVLNQGGDAKLEIVDWFMEKVEWKSNE